MKKLFFQVRHLSSSSCFLNHRYHSYLTPTAPTTLLQSHSHLLNFPNPKPYFFIPTLPFSTTTATTTRKPVAAYLIERLGFSEEDSLAISKKLLCLRDCNNTHGYQVTDLISFEKTDNVITYLQEYCGLDLSQVKKVVTKHPRVLAADVDKTLKPKVKLLQDSGFLTSDLPLVLSTNPRLYLTSDLGPAIQALRGIMGSDGYVVRALKGLKRDSASTFTKNLIPNVTMLENEYGFPRDKTRKFLAQIPNVVISRTERLREVLVRVEQKWGITRDSAQFLRAVKAVSGLSDEKIESKCQVFRIFGWTQSDIMSLISHNSNCLAFSEAKMKKSLEYYMNELGYKPAYLISRPALLNYSLENRVMPRHRVLSILKEKGLIKADFQFYSAFTVTESKFFDKFILPFVSVVPKLHEVYSNSGPPTEEQLLHSETSESERSTLVVVE